ncbi:hypothetical protein SAMN04488071_3334 [Kordiimonas lacus]|uniref:Uncharacterized protein n=2 Tax=Kordiimonas lacus TaxID=637679 RepID=A0A1G7E8D5_9PROT|nr:hypothetical protein SAMN04488071_3334 [Kordiimonas lacus]
MQLIRLIILTLSMVSTLVLAQPALAQLQGDGEDPRQLAHDIYVGVNRGSPPAAVALKLADVIRVYRFRCTRVTDYQVYVSRPNLLDIKVKCSGDPLYGVTVASNGYVAVYGGNGILGALDRRDGLIYSFSASGDVESDSRLTADQALDETVDRLQLDDGMNLWYVMAMFAVLLALMILIAGVWMKMWRRRDAKKRERRKIKPMARHTVQATTDVKDMLLKESTRVAANIYKHPSGIFIARGKRGKRRFFRSRFWAAMYRSIGLRMFETGAPQVMHVDMPGEAETPQG